MRISTAILGLVAASGVAASQNAAASIVVGPGFQESGYSVVYELAIPTSGARFNTLGVPYAVDNSASIARPFTRVGYYLELGSTAGNVSQWISISMDAFTNLANKIGVPNVSSGEYYRYGAMPTGWQGNANANVYSNVSSITTGTGIDTIGLEFWPSNYATGNGFGVPNASGGTFDFGDAGSGTSNGHGSMQIHNYGASQVLFAFNDWGGNSPGANIELGIGSQPTGHPDWTFADTGGSWVVKNMQILVDGQQSVPEPSTVLLLTLGGLGLWQTGRRSKHSTR